ncbi:hypothetical protein [Magnetospirillum sp. XM-1]|uniref:hypothetical protein n=1 Tax=Magnetospirillum sp. XM-1 TaxID=1663591 RepID=UPI000837F68F|nr:hypothetical protein [Magnetospirillum sp. XM-1]
MFDIDATHIAALDDTQLRELIRRLCAAELRRHGLPLSALTFGGDQDTPDGGIDGRVTLADGAPALDFIPRPKTGFQAKRTNITAGKVANAMHLKGKLYPSVQALGEAEGAYVIVSGKASATDSDLGERIDAMKAAMGDVKAPVLDFYDGPRVAGWVNDHPGVALWVRQVLGQPLSCWKPWGNWSHPAAGKTEVFLKDDKALITDSRRSDHPLDAETGIARLRSILRRPKGVVRLIGLSGTGKTRLAEALFDRSIGDDPLAEDLAVYTDLGDSPNPAPQEIIPRLAAQDRPIVLVIDNCPPTTHKSLADQVRGAGGHISLLTVEYDISDGDSEGTEVFRLDTASPEVIERLLAARYPLLSQLDRRRITELAGNNSRLALAMADAAPGDSLSTLKDSELFKRLFWQRDQADQNAPMQRAAEICSLVYSFDVEKRDEADAELPILAGLARMDVEDLYRYVATLLRRRLVQKRGDWRAVLPHVLANRLAVWALENTSLKQVVPTLINHPRLRTSFVRRLSFLHKSDEAKSIVAGWLAPGGWLGDALAMDGEDWKLVRLLAPVAADQVLTMIQRALASPEAGRLLQADNWQRDDAIRVLSALAYEPHMFEQAALALARFLSVKPDDKNAALRALKLLFQVNYSGTMADLDQRLRVLDQLLADPSQEASARQALDAMLKAGNFDIPYHLEFGGHSRCWGWRPPNDDAIRGWYAEAFARLEAVAAGGQADWCRSALARHFRGLWRLKWGIPDLLEPLCRRLSAQEFWAEGWLATQKVLRYQEEKGGDMSRLQQLADDLAPHTLEERVLAYGLSSTWTIIDAEEREGDQRPWDRLWLLIEQLGAELAGDGKAFKHVLPHLLAAKEGNPFHLGRGLARATKAAEPAWHDMVSALAALPPDQRNFGLLGGYLAGLAENRPELTDQFMDQMAATPELSIGLPYLQNIVGFAPAGLRRVIATVKSGAIPAWRFRNLVLKSDGRDETNHLLIQLIEAISALPDGGPEAAADQLLFLVDDSQSPPSEALKAFGRKFILEWRIEKNRDRDCDHALSRIVSGCLAGSNGTDSAAALARTIAQAAAEFKIGRFDYPHLIGALLETQPHVVLDTLLLSQNRYGERLLWDYDADEDTPLNRVPDKTLLSWANIDPTERYPLVAGLVRLFDKDHAPAPVMLHLIDGMSERGPVLAAMADNLGPSTGMLNELVATHDARAKGIEALEQFAITLVHIRQP